MAKNIDPFDPYKDRGANLYDPHSKKYSRDGDGLGLKGDAKVNPQANQAPEDAYGPGYLNDTKEGWLRGKGSPYPHFDSGPSGKRYDKRR